MSVFLYAGEAAPADVILSDPTVVRPTGGGSPQSVSVAGRSSVSTFGAVSAVPGGVSVAVTGRTSASTFGTVAFQAGGVTVAVTGRTSTSTYGTITGVPGNRTVAVTGRTSQSTYGAVVTDAAMVAVTGHTSTSRFGVVSPDILFAPRLHITPDTSAAPGLAASTPPALTVARIL